MVKEKNYVEKKKKEKTKGKIRFRRFDGINLILDSFPFAPPILPYLSIDAHGAPAFS